MISFRGCLAVCTGAIKHDRVKTAIYFAIIRRAPRGCILPVQNQPQPTIRRGACGIGLRGFDRSRGMRVIIAEDRVTTVPAAAFRSDQGRRINFKMADRIGGDIARDTIAIHPAIAPQKDSADFLWRIVKDQLLDFCQYGA